MNLAQLKQRFEQEGIAPAFYDLGRRSYDGVCLMLTEAGWAVFYSERGRDEAPMFVGDEAAACQYYYEFVQRQRYRRCVATSEIELEVTALRDQLRQQGVPAEITHVRYRADAWCHQVCVLDADEARARQLLNLPLKTTAPAAASPTAWARLRQWLGFG